MPDTPYVVVNIPKASPEEADAGVNDNEFVTPLGLTSFHEGHIASEAQALAGTDNDTIMTPLRVRQVFDGEPIFGLGTRNQAAVREIPAADVTLQFTGISTPNAAPLHPYRRTASAPVCPISFRSLDRYLPNGTVSPTNGGYWQIGSCQIVSSIAGSVGDGLNDSADANSDAFQQCIDTWMYQELFGVTAIGPDVLIPAGKHVVSRPIQLGYGYSFLGGHLKGSGRTFLNASRGTTIIPNFSNAPTICIQGARLSTVKELSLYGPNGQFVLNNGLFGETPAFDDTIAADCWSPDLDPDGFSRYAPCAGIAVDPYSGNRPAVSYPDVTYPSYATGSPSQYNKGHSTEVLMSELDIEGYVVGAVVKPGDADGNGDFIHFQNIRISECIYGISIGNAQARSSGIYNLNVARVHTAITTRTHGRQTGLVPGFYNFHGNRLIQVFDLTGTGFGGPFKIDNGYTEQAWRLGSCAGTAVLESALVFDSCFFGFELQSTASRGVPATIVSTAGGNVGVIFRGGRMQTYRSVFPVQTSYENIEIEGTLFRADPSVDRSNLFEKFAHNGTCGGLVLSLNLNAANAQANVHPKWPLYDLATGSSLTTLARLTDTWLGSRDNPTPLYANRHNGSGNISGGNTGAFVPPRSHAVSLTAGAASAFAPNASQTGRTLTLTFSGRSEATFMAYGGNPGDIFTHVLTATTFFVSARTDQVVTLVQQNNWRDTGSGPVPIDSYSLTSGVWYFGVTRYFASSLLYYADFTSGSAVLTNVTTYSGANTLGDGSAGEIRVGDYLFSGYDQGLFTRDEGLITAVDGTAKTITLSGAADRTATHVPLWHLVRPGPANV